jgi:translation initiation factor IF-2
VGVSGTTGQNIPRLIEAIEAESDLLDLDYDPNARFEGGILEVREDEKLGGIVSAVIGKQGTLKAGDWLAAEGSYARVRSIQVGTKQHINSLEPSIPALISGWKQPVLAGSSIQVVSSIKEAEELAKAFSSEEVFDESFLKQRMKQEEEIRKKRAFDQKVGISPARSTFDYVGLEKTSQLKLILKTDTAGSFEAISRELEKFPIQILRVEHPFSVQVSESDANILKSLPNTFCFVFSPNIPKINYIKSNLVKNIYYFQSIYDLVEKTEILLKGDRPITGKLSIIKIFKDHSGKGTIKANTKILAEGQEKAFKIISMKHGKDSVDSVERGAEFGLLIEAPEESFSVGDVLMQQTLQNIK